MLHMYIYILAYSDIDQGKLILMIQDKQKEQNMITEEPKPSRRRPKIAEWQGPRHLPRIPDSNFAVAMLDIMADCGDHSAIIDTETENQRTYSYICTNVPRVAGGLRAAGVVPGDGVLLISHNHIDHPLIMFSVMYCGAVYVPVNPELKPEELCQVIRASNSRWVVTHPSKLKNIEEAESLLPPGAIRKLWLLENDDDVRNHDKFSSLLASASVKPLQKDSELNFSEIPAVILFSSGTTGPPKGVMVSHTNLNFTISTNSYLQSLMGEDGPGMQEFYKNTLLIVPLCHSYGFLLLISIFLMGGRAVSLERFSPKKYFEAIEKFQITISPVVPHIANFLSKSPLLQEYDTSSVMAFSSTTAPLGTESTNSFMEKTGRLIASGYGLTECLGVTSNGGVFGFKPGSVGKVMPYVRIKIIDVNTGEALCENEEGEVCVHSPGIMLGYVNNPEATKAMIDEEGWMHTGDVGYLDEEDFLTITDRMKDLIKVKGFQVSPTELEAVLLGHDHVSEVAVIGVPHGRTGEAPRAYVVPVPGRRLHAKELKDFLAERVAPYKQLTGGLVFVKSLPRNHTGKVLRRKLKQEYLDIQSKL